MPAENIVLTIEGIQAAQDKNLRRYTTLRGSALYQAAQIVGLGLHRYAVQITHVDTGALKASHRLELKQGAQVEGRIYIDPNSINPKGKRPAEYGPVEHARGGSHAFYERTRREVADQLVRRAIAWIMSRFRSI